MRERVPVHSSTLTKEGVMKHEQESLVGIGEASRRLRVHPSTLKNMERRGLLTPFRDGRNFRFFLESEIANLSAQREPHRQERA